MRAVATDVADVLLVEHDLHADARGFVYEAWNEREFARHVAGARFVQDNHSWSHRGVLRGLHYQVAEPQGKLVTVVSGTVFDAVVDLRKRSRTFGRCLEIALSADERRSLWIPSGFAHGYLVVSECAEVHYKVTAYWAPQHERCIAWNDPDLAIAWPLSGDPVLSERDRRGVLLRDAEVFP
jgi:dTDP-4-dehydrorhamnose 3,5-epimerase